MLEVFRRLSTAPPTFYAVSPTKVFVMSVLTLGLYDLVFWWRHWRVRRENGREVSVFWRTFFSPFFYFDFVKQVSHEALTRDVPVSMRLGALPVIYIGLHIVGRVTDKLLETNTVVSVVLMVVATLGTASTLFFTQKAADAINEREGYRGPVNSGASAGAIVAGLLGGLFWAMMLLGAFLIAGEQT